MDEEQNIYDMNLKQVGKAGDDEDDEFWNFMVSNKYAVTQELLQVGKAYAQKIIEGLNNSPSHFHAVNYCKTQLKENGFIELKETEKWTLAGGKGYYFTRNNSTICAFLTGANCGAEPPSAFKIVGCHTDSPVLKIAPYSKL